MESRQAECLDRGASDGRLVAFSQVREIAIPEGGCPLKNFVRAD
jgi:hypothetical protein